MTRDELIAEAEYVARLTCRQIELVLIEVGKPDRQGRRIELVDWLTGRVVERDR